jgi:Ca2+-binding EF-hand superfamily protein
MQDQYDTIKNRARSLLSTGLNTGLSLLNSVASNFNQADESSGDEEHVAPAETDSFVERGARGIIVFPTTSQKTGHRKMMHINLYKLHFITYHDGNKRMHPCSDVLNIYKVSEQQVNVEMKGGRTKKIIFDREGMADRFHMYIEFINEQGRAIRRAYHEIDVGRTGRINRYDLERALVKVDLVVDEEGLERMMQFGMAGYDGIDYYNFFHFFIHSFVSNLRECLLEWLFQATSDDSEAMTSQRLAKIIRLLPGEIISFMPPEKVHWCVSGGSKAGGHNAVIFPGRICATNYRIVFLSSRKSPGWQQSGHSRYEIPAFFNMISMPLATLHKLYIAAPRSSIYLVGKDYRCLRVTLSGAENNRGNAEAYWQMLSMLAFPPTPLTSAVSAAIVTSSSTATLSVSDVTQSGRSVSVATNPDGSQEKDVESDRLQRIMHHLNLRDGERGPFFAYHYAAQCSSEDITSGWNGTDIIKEYERQGLVGSAVWRIVENKDYELSRSYPRYLALPRYLTPDQVKAVAAYRSQGRMPAITYRHRATEAVLTRAAQPLVGLTQKTCYEDTLLLDLYRTLGHPIAFTSTSGNNGSNHSNRDGNSGSSSGKHESNPTGGVTTARTGAPTTPTAPLATAKTLPKKLYILDARGKLAATLNMAAGKGTEDISQYHHTELVFGNIDNIHTMRASAQQFAEALAYKGASPSTSSSASSTSAMHQQGGGGGSGGGLHPHGSWLDAMRSPDMAALSMNARLDESGWLKHVRLLLVASSFAAEKLHVDRCSVLVHCSDGWDRTAQICSLTQLLLDPYFRTIEGFGVLIEKDWCGFGHKFHERLGHGGDEKYAPDERSPVFLQFLDCVHQIMHQFPCAFEYTEDLLVFIADHMHSGLFGSFLGNTEEQRRHGRLFNGLEETVSIWSYVLKRKTRFCRPTRSSASVTTCGGKDIISWCLYCTFTL